MMNEYDWDSLAGDGLLSENGLYAYIDFLKKTIEVMNEEEDDN